LLQHNARNYKNILYNTKVRSVQNDLLLLGRSTPSIKKRHWSTVSSERFVGERGEFDNLVSNTT
jgi:hypothetical protein